MDTQNFESLENLCKGRNNCSIKVRVLRKWKNTKKDVSAFNLLLLDDKDFRMHAFVGNELGRKFAHLIMVDKIYSISHFTVKKYMDKDINLPVELEEQIQFTLYTTVKEMQDDGRSISNNAFDFYDLEDLHKQATQDKYLTDVIGVVNNLQQLKNFVSTQGFSKRIVKFLLTDGRCKVKVTLWDDHAEHFQKCLTPQLEQPLIVIIESAKVQLFKDKPELTTWFSTSRVHINYNHHTVAALRKMVMQPGFGNYHFTTDSIITDRVFTLAQVLQLTDEYTEKKIIVQVVVKKLKPISNWIVMECTSCQDTVVQAEDKYICSHCKRSLRYADKKFGVAAICTDDTASVAIVFADRDVQRLTNSSAHNLVLENKIQCCPPILKQLENLELTILLHITEDNTKNASDVYSAAEIFRGHQLEDTQTSTAYQNSSTTQASTSSNQSYHLTNLNIASPTPTKPTGISRLPTNLPCNTIKANDDDDFPFTL